MHQIRLFSLPQSRCARQLPRQRELFTKDEGRGPRAATAREAGERSSPLRHRRKFLLLISRRGCAEMDGGCGSPRRAVTRDDTKDEGRGAGRRGRRPQRTKDVGRSPKVPRRDKHSEKKRD